MTLRESSDRALNRLQTVTSRNEAQWMVRAIFHHLKGYELADMLLKADEPVSDFIASKVDAITDRIIAGEPIQYVLGEARFYGMSFKVTPATLIPRPETEELTDMIVDRWGKTPDLRVMDLCTGSGCIAIALARNLPFARVDALDISPDALEVARENARTLKTRVNFIEDNLLTLTPPASPCYDIVVSNPPYVLDSEKSAMEQNVLAHEPHQALFVPDDDPLRFYRPILRYARTALREGGMVYLEINPLAAGSLTALARSEGWHDVTTVQDISQRNRFITLTR